MALGKFWLLITCGGVKLLWLTGIVGVRGGRLQIIYSFTALSLVSCGTWFFHNSKLIGLCQERLRRLLLLGQSCLVGIEMRWFGVWFPIVLYGGIWQWRNAWIFKGNERLIHDLKLLFLNTLFEWINASSSFTSVYFPNLLWFYFSCIFWVHCFLSTRPMYLGSSVFLIFFQ